MELTNREALEIAHAYGLTLRQFGRDIRACLKQARANNHPTKTPAQAFGGYMGDIAYEAACFSADLAQRDECEGRRAD